MTEKKRGCGYRKVGGLYLVGDGLAIGCDRLPLIVETCPTCNQGVKPSLGFSWIDANKLFGKCNNRQDEHLPESTIQCHTVNCKICDPLPDKKYGLMWVGSRFYTPESFVAEAKTMGISKRIGHIPKGLQLGDFILLGHREAGTVTTEKKEVIKVPGVFYGFHVTRIEMIITEEQNKDTKFLEDLEKRKITAVVVDDKDEKHQGTVYDKIEDEDNKQEKLMN